MIFGKSFHILLSRAKTFDIADLWLVPRRCQRRCGHFHIKHLLSSNAYFYQEERYKQGKHNCCLVFKSLHILKCDIMKSIFDKICSFLCIYKRTIAGAGWQIGHEIAPYTAQGQGSCKLLHNCHYKGVKLA